MHCSGLLTAAGRSDIARSGVGTYMVIKQLAEAVSDRRPQRAAATALPSTPWKVARPVRRLAGTFRVLLGNTAVATSAAFRIIAGQRTCAVANRASCVPPAGLEPAAKCLEGMRARTLCSPASLQVALHQTNREHLAYFLRLSRRGPPRARTEGAGAAGTAAPPSGRSGDLARDTPTAAPPATGRAGGGPRVGG